MHAEGGHAPGVVGSHGETCFGLFKFLLFGCLLGEDKGASASLVDSEFDTVDHGLLLGSQMQSMVDADSVSKLDEAKDILIDLVGILL